MREGDSSSTCYRIRNSVTGGLLIPRHNRGCRTPPSPPENPRTGAGLASRIKGLIEARDGPFENYGAGFCERSVAV
jgi:hypothetical protein